MPRNKGFSFDGLKSKLLTFFSPKKSFDRDMSKKIFDIISDKEDEEYRGRSRSKKNSQGRKVRNKKNSKAYVWLKKSLFVVGSLRFSRLSAAITLFVIIVLTSGSIVLASSTGIFKKILPFENENLIRTEKTLYIQDGNDVLVFQTLGGTVKEILAMNEIELEEDDIIYPSLNVKVHNRMRLEIKRAIDVTVETNEQQQTLLMYNGTVADALKEAGIEYDADDIIEPALDAELADGVNISFDSVELKTVTEEVVVEYETEYRETPTVLKGMYALPQKGKDGLAEVTYEVKYVNGEETSRKAIEEVMIKEPVNRVELHGTGLKRADSEEGEEESSTNVENPDEQATNPTVPGTTSTYVESIVAHVTAYTHTGSTTATGTWPRSTRTLTNPGSCAVVPGTFPYGSLLYVPGYGYCIAEDTGGFRHDPDRWNQIDVFMNTVEECITWGRKREWTIYVIRYGY